MASLFTSLVCLAVLALFVLGVVAYHAPVMHEPPSRLDDLDTPRDCECEDGHCLACTIDRHPAGGAS